MLWRPAAVRVMPVGGVDFPQEQAMSLCLLCTLVYVGCQCVLDIVSMVCHPGAPKAIVIIIVYCFFISRICTVANIGLTSRDHRL